LKQFVKFDDSSRVLYLAYSDYLAAFRSTIICTKSWKNENKVIQSNVISHEFNQDDPIEACIACYTFSLPSAIDLNETVGFTVGTVGQLAIKSSKKWKILLANDSFTESYECFENEATWILWPTKNKFLPKGKYHLFIHMEDPQPI
jgi:hypothetical protein